VASKRRHNPALLPSPIADNGAGCATGPPVAGALCGLGRLVRQDGRVTQTWTASLWDEGAATYRAILEHPFLSELTSGTLPPEKFGYYLAQDAHYLRDYARALAVVGSKAPTHAAAGMFARHAAATVDVELALHDSLLPELGLDPAGLEIIPVSPTTLGYTSYLLATAHGGSFVEGLAAVLPCYWIYARVGAALLDRGFAGAAVPAVDRHVRR